MRPVLMMHLRLSLMSIWLLAWIAPGCAGPQKETSKAAETPDQSRPNIVVFVADDQGFRDIGYHGSEIRTPNLDRLARTGVRLEQFYVYPTCSPTRVGFLTGRNPSRFEIAGPIAGKSRKALPGGTPTLGSRLQKLGYTTAITGKWHLGLRPEVGPRKYGFDYSYGLLHGGIDPYTHRYKYGDRTWHRNDVLIDEEGHVTDLIAREAVAFIEKHKQHPFFLYVSFTAPHYPLDEPERWTGPYTGRIANAWRRQFAAAVTHMDDSIGQVVAALAREGLKDNTLIVFFSDNGGQEKWDYAKNQYDGRYPAHDRLGDNRPLRGWKCQLYEGGIRVPAFVHWPKRLRPRIVNDVTSVYDLLPTFLSVAAEQDETEKERTPAADEALLEGMNIWPVLAGTGVGGPRVLYWNTGRQCACRVGDWKLIQDRKSGLIELFNLADDPYELTDLAQDDPDQVQIMLNALRRQQALDPGSRGAR